MSTWKSAVIGLALAGVVGGGGYYVWQSRQEVPAGLATGRAAGGGQKTGQIWAKLEGYRETYLRKFFAAYDKEQPTATDALEGFNELAYQVSGPGGFWRKEVPNKWLGCKAQPDSASCGAIGVTTEEMAKWDTLQEQIVGVSETEAGKFLDAHAGEMLGYFDALVPDETSSAGMQKTPLFEKHLKAAMQQDGML